MIDDIIDISKIEAGQIKIKITECNVNHLLYELYESFNTIKLQVSKDNIILKKICQLPDENTNIFTDPFRLRQIISNLIGNALKFTFEGFIEFGYKYQQSENQLLFYVKDTGIGIPRDKQDLIFERFGQVIEGGSINQKGTGLGLAISNNLTKLLGGTMWVDSSIGKGSTFYFTIPYNITSSEKTTPIFNSNNQFNDSFNGKTILIADDEETNFIFYREMLKKTGLKLIWVRNGLEAIDVVKTKQNISLVLMDCKMPVMDGFQATLLIKQLNKNLPVIAQTAFNMHEERERCFEVGCNEYITKPLRQNELIKILNNYIK